MDSIQFGMWKRRMAWKAFDVFDRITEVIYDIAPSEAYRKFEVKMGLKLLMWIIRHT